VTAPGSARLARRSLLSLAIAPLLTISPADAGPRGRFDVSGSTPRLAFTMMDATTGKQATAADFRGQIVMLYLGYTQCPDICPLTLHNLAGILGTLGKQAGRVRVLFVTVDPNRDSLPLLRQYAAAFSPEIVGLRGSPDELARLARRYRLAYSVSPATRTHPYEVMHSSAIYVFSRNGHARYLIPPLESADADLSATKDDLERLLQAEAVG
jgi:protein SCO1/2